MRTAIEDDMSTQRQTQSTRDNNDAAAGRAFSAASAFLSGILAITVSQIIGSPLRIIDSKLYNDYMAWTKESFAVLVTAITQWWSPTVIRVTGDDSMKDQLYQMPDGSLRCNFPHRIVLMANHQLYTDWLYLWWTAYTNKMHGHIYIIMKESLKQLPIIGWSAQLYNFIFLSRRWEADRKVFSQSLAHLRYSKKPMWLLIFPEGTNLSVVTREKSAAWATKSHTSDMTHQLLPRSTALKFCLDELGSTTNWLYDCTIAYEGIPRGGYGQDIFTLRSSFLEGKPPKSVNMFWRRFRIADIPRKTDKSFSRWLLNRWREKDYLLAYFEMHGHFPALAPVQALKCVKEKSETAHARSIGTMMTGGGMEEFIKIFEPITATANLLSSVDMTEPVDMEALARKVASTQLARIPSLKSNTAAKMRDELESLLKDVSSRPTANSVNQSTLIEVEQAKQTVKSSKRVTEGKRVNRSSAKRTSST